MSSSLAPGLIAALGSALALNWGYWAQHGAASGLPRLSPRQPVRSLRLLLAQPRWVIGFAVGLGGWALYVVALKLAPLSLVQGVSAGGIGVLVLLVWRLGGDRPARRELISVSVALAGLILLALSLANAAPHSGRASLATVAVWVGGALVFALVIVGPGARIFRRGAAFGIAAGVLYAAGDIVTKVAVTGGGRLGLVLVMLACHGLAFVVLQLGFQRGGVLATAGLASLFTNVLPIAAGIVLFGEALPSGWAGAVRVVAFAALVVGGGGLVRAEQSVEPLPSVPPIPPARAIPVGSR